MAEHNQIIPPEIWPQIQDEAPWDSLPQDVHKRLQQDSEIYFSKWTVTDQYLPIEPIRFEQTEEWPSLSLGRPAQHLGITHQHPAHTSEGLRLRQRLYEKSLSPPRPNLNIPGPSSTNEIIMDDIDDPELALSLSNLPTGPPGHYYEDSQDPYAWQDSACACHNPYEHEPQCNMGTP